MRSYQRSAGPPAVLRAARGDTSGSSTMQVRSSWRSRFRRRREHGEAERVVIVDLGDRVVLRTVSPRGVDDLVGKYAGPGPSTDALSAAEQADEGRWRCVVILDVRGQTQNTAEGREGKECVST